MLSLRFLFVLEIFPKRLGKDQYIRTGTCSVFVYSLLFRLPPRMCWEMHRLRLALAILESRLSMFLWTASASPRPAVFESWLSMYLWTASDSPYPCNCARFAKSSDYFPVFVSIFFCSYLPALFVCAFDSLLSCPFAFYSGCFWLLLAASSCFWLHLAASDCFWLLLSTSVCSWLLPAAPSSFWLLLAALKGLWLLLDAPDCFWLLLAASGCFWLLLAGPGCSWLLLAAYCLWVFLAAPGCSGCPFVFLWVSFVSLRFSIWLPFAFLCISYVFSWF